MIDGVVYPSREWINEQKFQKKEKEFMAKKKVAVKLAVFGKVDINKPDAWFAFRSVFDAYISGYERNHNVVLGDDLIEKFWEMNNQYKISACFKFLNLIIKKYKLDAVDLSVWANCKKDIQSSKV